MSEKTTKTKKEPLFGPDFFKQFSTKEALAYWIAMPKAHKQPKMQKDLAEILGITEERLSRIKKEKGFSDMVTEYRKEYFKNFTSCVLEAVRKKAEAGDPRSQKLFFQYVEDWKETTVQEQEKTERREYVFVLSGQELNKLKEIIKQENKLQAEVKGYLDYEIIKDDNEEISDKQGSE